MTKPIVARSRRAGPILVCKKCLGRCAAGAKIRREVKRDLRRRWEDKKKVPRLVTASCFGICPKRAVVLASGRSLQNSEYVLVSQRRDVEGSLDALLPPV